ncbi:cell number regulator 6 [Vicia villosa]|uniref:cell number regulator 6 n=1 Tax=Vicia villosa TaxID=3911 RepID=UPI00273B9BBD|nr:cell number regulator 6 [Vicia villosa]
MGDERSRYVKLNKDKEQAPFRDITPGELNQPIDIPQLNPRRCLECGQVLPETYQPPADEDWTTGICGCFEDIDSCRTGLFCPCVLFGRNTEALRDDIPWTSPCVCHAMCVEGGMALAVATAFLNGIDPETSCLIAEGLFFTWWMCGIYTGLFRQSLQKQYHLKDSPCDPCMVHCCLHWCAICQEHREMRNHLPDNTNSDGTIINPPPVQEITSDLNKESTSSPKSSKIDDEENNLQIQPI